MDFRDALLISAMDLVTSVIAGFVVFTTFGGMATTIGTTVDKVAKAGEMSTHNLYQFFDWRYLNVFRLILFTNSKYTTSRFMQLRKRLANMSHS